MVVKAKKKEVEARFTCPLCSNVFVRATTIYECLHTFCKSCIEDKLTKAKLKACPVCKVDLGGFAHDKLRADNTLENLNLKLFPRKQEIVKAGPETVAATLKSSKKDEKSLSSLHASTSRVTLSPNLNQDTSLEPNVPVIEKLSEKVEAKMYTAPKFLFDLNTVPDCGLDEDYVLISSEEDDGKKLKSNGKGNQEYATSSSLKVSGKKKSNGKGHQTCHTPKSGNISANKLKEKSYSPPVLRPRIRGRAMSSAAGEDMAKG